MRNGKMGEVEGIDYVVCPFCGAKSPDMRAHIYVHLRKLGITWQQFKEQYPNVQITSEKSHKRRLKGATEAMKLRWQDPLQRADIIKSQKKGKSTSQAKKNSRDAAIASWQDDEFRAKIMRERRRYDKEHPEESFNSKSKGRFRYIKEHPEEAFNSSSRGGKRNVELHPENIQLMRDALDKNSPYCHMGICWNNSSIQMNITRLLFEKLGIISIKDLNCKIYYSGGEYDFKLLGCIYEPHVLYSYNNKENKEQYVNRKRSDMDSNGHKNYELIVTTTYKEAQQLITWLSERIPFMMPDAKDEIAKFLRR